MYHNSVKSKKIARLVALLLTVSLLLVVFAAATDSFVCYEVSHDGEVVGYVDSVSSFENSVETVEDHVSSILGYEYAIPGTWTCTLKLSAVAIKTDSTQIVEALLESVEAIDEMYVLTVDGVDVAGASNDTMIETVLDALKKHYTTGDETEVKFINDISVTKKVAPRRILMNGIELFNYLLENQTVKVCATYSKSTTTTVERDVQVFYDETKSREYKSVSEGRDGVFEVVETYTLVNGKEVTSDRVETIVHREAISDVVVYGTKNVSLTHPTGTYINPVTSGKFTSDYGKRGGYEFHTGVDICNRAGTEIFASDSGKVVFAGWKGTYGYYIIIEHGDGIQTRYAHLASLKVKEGDKVMQGQVIATMGSTGRSTGTHLHFEVTQNGENVDPGKFIDMAIYEDYRGR